MRRVRLIEELRRVRPELGRPEVAVAEGRVVVDGRVVTNPASLVSRGCSIVLTPPRVLRGSVKLRAALDEFLVAVDGRVCLDVGASTGGFTTVLLERGAKRVYAVDAGHGQLLGSLRRDPRVVNLEATNVGDLTTVIVPDVVDLVTVDVSYLSLSAAVVQLNRVVLAPGAELVGLVKPMFELGLPTAPRTRDALDEALRRAVDGIEEAGWRVARTMDSPVAGGKGSPELFAFARRSAR